MTRNRQSVKTLGLVCVMLLTLPLVGCAESIDAQNCMTVLAGQMPVYQTVNGQSHLAYFQPIYSLKCEPKEEAK